MRFKIELEDMILTSVHDDNGFLISAVIKNTEGRVLAKGGYLTNLGRFIMILRVSETHFLATNSYYTYSSFQYLLKLGNKLLN